MMNIKEFVEFGYLQEVNRQFFHPLGLALEVVEDEAGKLSLGGIWDFREEKGEMIFKDGVLSSEKAARVIGEQMKRAWDRKAGWGWVQQPVDDELTPEEKAECDRLYEEMKRDREENGPWPEYTGDGK